MSNENSTLAQRLDWVVENYFGGSKRALSLESGMSDAYVGKVIRGDIAESSVSLESLRKIAAAAKVDFAWLSSGQGQPSPGVEFSPLPPARGRRRLTEMPARAPRPIVAEPTYEDLEASMDAIDAAVLALALDEGGVGYVRTTLRSEARSTGFRDRYEVFQRAAELARVYEHERTGRPRRPGHEAGAPEPVREGGIDLPLPKRRR